MVARTGAEPIQIVGFDPGTPDELSLCDDDIREIFEGTQYLTGTPLMAQLAKEMKLLRLGSKPAREIEYEYKLIERPHEGYIRIAYEDSGFIEDGKWEIICSDIRQRDNFYCLQLKREVPSEVPIISGRLTRKVDT